MEVTRVDEDLLRRAVQLAARARENGEAPFGALLADPDGAVLAEEINTVASSGDISAHPELKLAVWAARTLTPAAAATTTLYTSCQPCEMCTAAIRRAELARVVFALPAEQLSEISPGGGFPPVPLAGPALVEEARAAVAGYRRDEPQAKRGHG
jgi:tRNA(Arg) A34 adenosine deaminase TadA